MLREMNDLGKRFSMYTCPPNFKEIGSPPNVRCKCNKRKACGSQVVPASAIMAVSGGSSGAARPGYGKRFGTNLIAFGLSGFGKLTSNQAGEIRRTVTGVLIQAYDLRPSQQMLAQKITLPSSIATAIATQYANLVQAGDSYPTPAAIASDPRLAALVKQMAPGSKSKGGLSFLTNLLPAKDVIPGIPNWMLAAGGAVLVGAVVFKKMRKGKK